MEPRIVQDPFGGVEWRYNGLQLEIRYVWRPENSWEAFPSDLMFDGYQPAERVALWRDLFLNPCDA